MELSELKELINDPNELVIRVMATKLIPVEGEQKLQSRTHDIEALKQYHTATHDVMDEKLRKNKIVNKPTGLFDKDNNPIYAAREENVGRIPIAFQKIITTRAASFLVGVPVKLAASPADDTEKKLLAMVQKTWNDNKLDYKTKKLAKLMMSETECAELWFNDDASNEYWGDLGFNSTGSNGSVKSNKKLRMIVLSPSMGDFLYPVFDMIGDMVAFGRQYTVFVNEELQTRFDIYTDTECLKHVMQDNIWTLDDKVPHNVGKIPVIYYNQAFAEWHDVQAAINRFEHLISNYADTNDYFGAPLLVSSGEVEGFASKGDSGKVLKVENGGKVEYLTWNQAPEAIKLEMDTLLDVIYTMTQTPNITFKEVAGLGALSGIAIKLLFMDAHMKAKDKQDDVFGECIQRRINFLKAAMVKINSQVNPAKDLNITPTFGLFSPDNTTEQLADLNTATGGKQVLSQKTAIALNPLVGDPDKELAQIELEAKQNLPPKADPANPSGQQFVKVA